MLESEGKWQNKETSKYIKLAAESMPDAHYPMLRAVSANVRRLNYIDKDKQPDEYQKISQQLADQFVAMFSVANLQGFDRRFAFNVYNEHVARMSTAEQKNLVDRLAAVQADPWCSNVIAGVYHSAAAWDARGHGWSSQVTPEGWKGFELHMGEARKCFAKAYAIEPKFPEAPAQMIEVAMTGAKSVSAESPRVWFERAVKAQFDDLPAYDALLQSLMPRWNGTHQLMLNFAEECAATKRYDTSVPDEFFVCADDVAIDIDGDPQVYQRPAVYKTACEVLEGYAASPREGPSKNWYLGMKMGLAYKSGHVEDVAQTLPRIEQGELPQKRLMEGLDAARVVPSRLLAAAPIVSGPHAAEVKAAEQKVAARQLPAAIAAYEQIGKSIKPVDAGAAFIPDRILELKWQQAFESGEWVPIQPDSKLSGWWTVGGKWSVDADGSLLGEADALGLGALCGSDFGQNYELSASLEFQPSGKGYCPAPGELYLYDSYATARGVFSWARGKKAYDSSGGYGSPHDATFTGHDVLTCALWRGQLWSQLNGATIINGKSMFEGRPQPPRGYVGVGVWSYGVKPGVKLRVRDIKIRKLTASPTAGKPPADGKL
jgi:hypothetical protein